MKRFTIVKDGDGKRKKKGRNKKKKEVEPIAEIHIRAFPHGTEPQVKVSGSFMPFEMQIEIMQLATLEVAKVYMLKALAGQLDQYGRLLGVNGQLIQDSNEEVMNQIMEAAEAEGAEGEANETEGEGPDRDGDQEDPS